MFFYKHSGFLTFLSVSYMKKHRLFVFGLFLACLFSPIFASGGVTEVLVENDTRFTGCGNRHEILFHLTVSADSEVNLKAMKLDFLDTDWQDIDK